MIRTLFALLFLASVCGAYVPPIGIPDPGFGIDENRPSRPSVWTSDIAGYYYVNAQTGSNTGRTYGNPTAPRQSIPHPLPAGSYVELHGNYNYSDGEYSDLSATGTSGGWVANTSGPAWIIGGAAGDSMPWISVFTLISGSYLYIDSINFRTSTINPRIQIGTESSDKLIDHIFIARSRFISNESESSYNGISILSKSYWNVHDVLIYKNYIYGCGPNGTLSDIDICPILSNGHTKNLWVLENTASHCAGGMKFGGADINEKPYDDSIYIGKNDVSYTAQVGIALKYASNIIISENYCHRITDTEWSVGKGIGMQYGGKWVWCINNWCDSCVVGIRSGSDDGGLTNNYSYYIGNLITNGLASAYNPSVYSTGWGFELTGSNRYAINNTIVNCGRGIVNWYDQIQNGRIEGNLISKSTGGYDIFLNDGVGSGANMTCKNNLFSGTAKIRWNGTDQNLTAFVASYGKGQGCIEGSAGFVDSAGGNFGIQSNSEAVNSGGGDGVTGAYDLYYTMYGINIKKDRLNISRPQNTLWDIGAYEYNAGSTTDSIRPYFYCQKNGDTIRCISRSKKMIFYSIMSGLKYDSVSVLPTDTAYLKYTGPSGNVKIVGVTQK